MVNETFFIDSIDAKTAGIQLSKSIIFDKAVRNVETIKISGRNGNLIFDLGNYLNRTGFADCFCLQNDVEKAISAAGRFLKNGKGYRRLETSDDPDHFWMARVVNSPAINQKLRCLAPFTIEFDCKPQRFLKSGEEPVSFDSNGFLFNQYGQTAIPIITVYGNGSGRLAVGDCTVDIKSFDGLLCLDSDTQNAYNESGNQNDKINAPIFPVLGDGEIPVSFSGGIERVEIIPRWWEL